MKKNLSYFLFIATCFIYSCYGIKNKKETAKTNFAINTSGNKTIPVLELFTSQGCSSCPPADRLLGKLASDKKVIALAFHVDYWNRLGWIDSFSTAKYSQRQSVYASALHADVYTPQLIVNGSAEMIGSDSAKIMNEINKISMQQSVAGITIKSARYQNGKAIIDFNTSGNISDAALNVAIVQKQMITKIKAGENGGRTLTDFNVVRNFETLNDFSTNSTSIDVPGESSIDNILVILFLQQKTNGKIIAADQSSL